MTAPAAYPLRALEGLAAASRRRPDAAACGVRWLLILCRPLLLSRDFRGASLAELTERRKAHGTLDILLGHEWGGPQVGGVALGATVR